MPNAKITCSSQVYFIVIFPCLPLVQGKPSFSLAKKLSNSTSPAYPWRTVFFGWQKISSLQIIRLMRGELSFYMANNFIVPNYPTSPLRTVFFHGKKSHRSKLSDLCVANCLFPWQKNFPTRLLRLIRGELSFLPDQEYHRS